jgi:hypothetical protein
MSHSTDSTVLANYKLRFFIHVILPILIGVLIYAFFRKTSGLIASERWGLHWMTKAKFSIPDFVKYNLPDGLWLYAFTNFNILIWKNQITKNSFIWIFLIPFLGISTEILQYNGLFIGTYDTLDLVVYVLATALSFLNCKIKFHYS